MYERTGAWCRLIFCRAYFYFIFLTRRFLTVLYILNASYMCRIQIEARTFVKSQVFLHLKFLYLEHL